MSLFHLRDRAVGLNLISASNNHMSTTFNHRDGCLITCVTGTGMCIISFKYIHNYIRQIIGYVPSALFLHLSIFSNVLVVTYLFLSYLR